MCGLCEARLKKCRRDPLAWPLRLHFSNLASHSPHIVYQEYICQCLGDVHEISKVLPPTSSNPNQQTIYISGASWDLAISGRIFDPDFFLARHGTVFSARKFWDPARHGTARNITENCFDTCRKVCNYTCNQTCRKVCNYKPRHK